MKFFDLAKALAICKNLSNESYEEYYITHTLVDLITELKCISWRFCLPCHQCTATWYSTHKLRKCLKVDITLFENGCATTIKNRTNTPVNPEHAANNSNTQNIVMHTVNDNRSLYAVNENTVSSCWSPFGAVNFKSGGVNAQAETKRMPQKTACKWSGQRLDVYFLYRNTCER